MPHVQEHFQYSKAGMDEPSLNYNALEHAIGAGNVMHLLGPFDTFNTYKAIQEEFIFDEITRNKSCRDAHDLIGKLMLCQTAKASGISDSQLVVDHAQAGGLMGKSDGALIGPNGQKQPIEIKGSHCKKEKKSTVFVKDIRLRGTDWQHLFIVSREQDPDLWTDVSEYGRCGLRLAYVKRRHLLRAMRESGRGHLAKVDATITPGSKRSWLGPYVRWVRFQDISREWWDRHVFSDGFDED